MKQRLLIFLLFVCSNFLWGQATYCLDSGPAYYNSGYANMQTRLNNIEINHEFGADQRMFHNDPTKIVESYKGGIVEYTIKLGTYATSSSNWHTPGHAYYRVFVDFNQDGDFNDQGELLFHTYIYSQEYTLGVTNGYFNIPTTALTGNTRLRIQILSNENENNADTSCMGRYNEDYTINIAENCFNNLTPPVITTTTQESVAVNALIPLNSDATSLNYFLPTVWQTSTNLQNWVDTDLTNINNPNISFSNEGIVYIRQKITCRIYNQVAYSNIIQRNIVGTTACINLINLDASNVKINELTIGDTSYSSTVSSDYEDLTNKVFEIIHGTSKSFNLSSNYLTSGTNNDAKVKVWIDYNGDGTFDDSEVVLNYNHLGNGNANNQLINIPLTKKPINTKMRVALTLGNNPENTGSCILNGQGQVKDYSLNIKNACNSIGNDFVINASKYQGLNQEFQFTVSGAQAYAGDNYYWQKSTDNINWENYTAPTQGDHRFNDSFQSATLGSIYYRLAAHCNVSNFTQYSNSFEIITTQNYCKPQWGLGQDSISNVTFANINKSSSLIYDRPGYENFLDTNIYVKKGNTYPISISSYGHPNKTKKIYAWIDYNGDGNFDNNSELVLNGIITNNNQATQSQITIPSNINTISTRMRLYFSVDSDLDHACDNVSRGQIEDYTIHIENNLCSSITQNITISPNITDGFVYLNEEFNFNITGINQNSGVNVIWQTSNDGENWSDLEGATTLNSNFTNNSIGTKYYRLKLICDINSYIYSNTSTVIYKYNYCNSNFASYNTQNNYHINKLEISNIFSQNIDFDYSSSIHNYKNFTLSVNPINLEVGSTHQFKINFSGPEIYIISSKLIVWIDYNNDGDFNDEGELVVVGNNGYRIHSYNWGAEANVHIPSHISPVTSTMRVMHTSDTDDLNPCGNSSTFHVVDYTVNINPTSCSSINTSISAPVTEYIVNYPVQFTTSGFEVNSFKIPVWQTSTDNVNWTDISETNFYNPVFVNSVEEVKHYRIKTTCTLSNQEYYSNVVTINYLHSYCPVSVEVVSLNTGAHVKRIDNVKIGRSGFNILDNTSTSTEIHENFKNITVNLYMNNSYDFSVERSGTKSPEDKIMVWIDWNNDKIFNNENELVINEYFGEDTFNSNILIHNYSQESYITGMRVKLFRAIGQYDTNNACSEMYVGQVEDYTLNLQTENCDSIANMVATTTSENRDINTPFTLGVQGYIPSTFTGSPIWQVSFNQTNWNDVVNGEGVNAIISYNWMQTLYYRLKVRCLVSHQDYYSTPVKIVYNIAHCVGGSYGAENLRIDNVTMGPINNTSTSTSGFETFTDTVTYLEKGMTYNFSASYNGNHSTGVEKVYVWIDYDFDGVYNNTNELVLVTDAHTNLWTGQITIPSFINNSEYYNTRMRVKLVQLSPYDTTVVDPCFAQSIGQVEEYAISFINPSCPGFSNNIVIEHFNGNNLYNGQLNQLYTSTFNNTTGGELMWQKSTDNINWTDTGVNQISYTETVNTNANTTWYYRLKFTCNGNGWESLSNVIPIQVNVTYCQSNGANGGFIKVTSAQIADMNYTSTSNAGYLDFTNNNNYEINVVAGEEYNFTINQNYSYDYYFPVVSGWIDFNVDGIFDYNELVLQYGFYDGATSISSTFDVLGAVNTTQTRMRIIVSDENSFTYEPCGNYTTGQTIDFKVNITQNETVCTLPNPDEFIITPEGEFGADVYSTNISATGIELNNLTTVIWQESDNNVDWTDIEYSINDLSQSFGSNVAKTMYYRLKATCFTTNENVYSNTITAVYTYCIPTGNINSTTHIKNVKLNQIDHSSNSVNIYENYLDFSTHLYIGQSYSITVDLETSGYANAWIDYNGNEIFDIDEKIPGSFGNGLTTLHFNVPNNIDPKSTRLRVKVVNGYVSNLPCWNNGSGQTYDYQINLVPPTCMEITSINIDNSSTNSVTISWQDVADQYLIEYGPEGFLLGTGNQVNSNTNQITLSNLDISTKYEIYVKNICEQDSYWSSPFKFNTESCEASDKCNYIITLTKNYSSYSQDKKFVISQNGLTVQTLNIQDSQLAKSFVVALCNEIPFTIDVIGYSSQPIGLKIESAEGNVLLNVPADQNQLNEGYNIELLAECTPTLCLMPRNLTIGSIEASEAQITWTEASEATQWEVLVVNQNEISYPTGDESNIQIVTGTPSFNITDLNSLSNYTVFVRAICQDNQHSVWASIDFSTTMCNQDESCVYTFTLTDDQGDGWNEYTSVYIGYYLGNDEYQEIDTLTLDSGYSATFQISVCSNLPIEMYGWSEDEQETPHIGFSITNAFNEVIYSSNNGLESDLIFSGYLTCEAPTCLAPSGIVANQVGEEITISWTENAEATQWDIILLPSNANYPTVDSIPTTTITSTTEALLTNIQSIPQGYNVFVRSVCSEDDLSNWIKAKVNLSICEPENQCNYTFTLYDDYGDGWNDAEIGVYQNGMLIQKLAIIDEVASQDFEIALCSDMPFSVSLLSEGEYPEEISFVITDPFENVILETEVGIYYDFSYNGFASCTEQSCIVPSNIVSDRTDSEITISWTENGEATQWEVLILPATEPQPTIDATPTLVVNSEAYAVITDIEEIDYKVYVRSICSPTDMSLWNYISVNAPGETCDYVFTLTDSYGDGWNGAEIIVIQNNQILETLTLEDGSEEDFIVTLNSELPFIVSLSETGSYLNEIGLIIQNSNSEIILDSQGNIEYYFEFTDIACYVSPCSTPSGEDSQVLLAGQTLNDLNVSGDNLVWYYDEHLVYPVGLNDGIYFYHTYYAVNQTEDCISNSLAVTILCEDNTWIGDYNSDWFDEDNWCSGNIPYDYEDVKIAHNYFENYPIVDYNLYLGSVYIADNAVFTLQSWTNIIQNEDAVNTGTFNIQQESAKLIRQEYAVWSSPVSGMKVYDFSPETLVSRIYTYGINGLENNNPFVGADANGFSSNSEFEIGRGYFYRAPNNWHSGAPDFTPLAPQNFLGEFVGTINNGDITVNVNSESFTSVGNPYPSAIDIQEFRSYNQNLNMYFYTSKYPDDYDNREQGYAYFNSTGYNPIGTESEPHTINVGQGFLVWTNESQVLFNNQMRSTNYGEQFRSVQEDASRVYLSISKNNVHQNNILIGYVNGASNGIDNEFDTTFIDEKNTRIYSLIDNSNQVFAIQGRSIPFNDTDVVKLGFKTNEPGNYSINLNNYDGTFAQGQNIYLKDNFTQTITDIKQGAYVFVSEPGVFENRFEVIYRTNQEALSVNENVLDSQWIAYNQNGTISIEATGFEIKDIVIYDMLGREIYSAKEVNNKSHKVQNLGANQVLIIKVINQDEKSSSRKLQY